MPEISNELSERELEILRLVATGASNKEIARQLFISANTVKVHLRNIYAKIGVVSRTEAAMYAVNNGLLPVGLPALEQAETEGVSEELESGVIQPESAPAPMPPRVWWMFGLAVAVFLVLAVSFWRPGLVIAPGAVERSTATEAPRWQNLSPMLHERSGLSAAVYENQIYVIAGETMQGVTGSVERYDSTLDTWTELQSKPTPVKEAGAAVLGGRISCSRRAAG